MLQGVPLALEEHLISADENARCTPSSAVIPTSRPDRGGSGGPSSSISVANTRVYMSLLRLEESDRRPFCDHA
jgi:hypothetical protein